MKVRFGMKINVMCLALSWGAMVSASQEISKDVSPASEIPTPVTTALAPKQAVVASQATVTLVDGSRLKGESGATSLVVDTIFKSDLELQVNYVKEVSLDKSPAKARVLLSNGDVISGAVKTSSFGLRSLLGDMTIPYSSIRQVSFAPMRGSDEGLIYYTTFDDAEAFLDPVVGPKGHLGNATFAPGKIGNAAYVPRLGNVGIVELPKGFLGVRGCIEFWAKIDVRREMYGDCDPRFVQIRFRGGNDVIMEYSDNNGGGKGGFNIRLPGQGLVSSNRLGGHTYSEILGAAETKWHHYAVSWSETKCTFYLDGKPVRMGYAYEGRMDESILNGQTSELGFPNVRLSDGSMPRSAFWIDEFKIWNFEKTEFDL